MFGCRCLFRRGWCRLGLLGLRLRSLGGLVLRGGFFRVFFRLCWSGLVAPRRCRASDHNADEILANHNRVLLVGEEFLDCTSLGSVHCHIDLR